MRSFLSGAVVLVMLSAACADSGNGPGDGVSANTAVPLDSTPPDPSEIARRGVIVARVLLGREIPTPSLTDAAALECPASDNGDLSVDQLAFNIRVEVGSAATEAIATKIAVWLSACPESRWSDLAAYGALVSGLPLPEVESLVDAGVQALTG